MDLSKLPKLSQTPTNNPPPSSDPSSLPVSRDAQGTPVAERSSTAAEAWISIAVGAILLLLYPTMLKYISSRLFGTYFAPFLNPPPDGTGVPYPRVYPQFFGDLCITLFAFVLILDGITIALLRRIPFIFLLPVLLLTLIVTAMNLYFVISTTSTYGLPIASALAVVVGVYIIILQGSTFHRLSHLCSRGLADFYDRA